MTSIAKAIRNKRFDVIKGSKVHLVIQAPTGTHFTLAVENCSLTGLGTCSAVVFPEDEGIVPGTILPPAKLLINETEVYIGRLVLRSQQRRGDMSIYGFQSIDAKMPIDGPLSRVLEYSAEDHGNAYDYELDPEKFNLASFRDAEQSNVDLFGRCRQFGILYQKWKASPKYQYRNVRLPSKGARVNLSIRRKGGRNDFLVMGSNDYLGLSHHPKVLEAAKTAIDEYGFGSTGSAVSTGYTLAHEELCDFIAKLFRKEKAMLYNSGYAANIGIITGLTSELDLVVADILSHMSIQDAMQMAHATSRFFKHNKTVHLAKLLSEERAQYAGALVVTEGVFSMDGDLAPVNEIARLAKKHNARFMLDEAHSFGVVGDKGLGCAARYGVLDDVDIVMGTFSKVCGGIGGFAVGSTDAIEWLYHFARAHVFTVSIPPSTAAAALAALKIFVEEPALVTNLQRNIKHFVAGLKELGFSPDPSHESAVIPVIIGDERKLGVMNEVLLNDGVFVVPVVYPGVSRSGSRFRFTMMAGHTTSDLDFVLSILEKAMLKANFDPSALLEKKQVA